MITKKLIAEEVIRGLQDGYVNRDIKIFPEEVYLQLDAFVNQMAKAGYIDNWKMGNPTQPDDSYMTSFEWLNLTDPTNGMPSNIVLPATPVVLPNSRGIDSVYFKNDFSEAKRKYFEPVIIVNFRDVAGYRSNMAGNNQGRLTCYQKNNYLFFTEGDIFATYGPIGIRMVIRDSSSISDSAPYPIDASIKSQVVAELIQWFRDRRAQPTDLVRDANDNP